ncbi:unnamed protein product [Diatraea saccharalis]|uniref:Amine oxidase domain-containing protein n=1 Tax=Diatraea saccharalis TaxID=40085 RepID=A0A9N9R6G0_9NEOP|nr:unnamed protein product [Diatraea saccharalis]
MYDTIVVGLGASGASAASTLARSGKRVLVLEAQNRVGGRVCTVPFGDGVVELGAEWIHGQRPSSVYDLAIQNNVPVISQDISMDVYLSDGSKGDRDLINELVAFALEVCEDPPKEAQPLGQYITSRLLDYIKGKYPDLLKDQDYITELLAFLDLVIDNYEATTSWNDVTTESKYRELDGDQHISWHRNGYKTLFEILLNTYNNGTGLPNLEYKLNKEVTQINWSQDPSKKVTVTCKDGSSYTAENVIVTVSIGVLKERHSQIFSPTLPPIKIKSIQTISIGVMDKIILLFPYSWWPKNSSFFGFLWRKSEKKMIEEDDRWVTQIFGMSTPLGCDKAITLWTSGDAGKTIETLPDEVIKKKSMELIRRFMGANTTVPDPIDMIRSSWYTNPYTRGSYTYDHVASPLHPTARADLAQPITDAAGAPRILFAGEATDPSHFSTVHGAVDSGRRVAAILMPKSIISSCPYL